MAIHASRGTPRVPQLRSPLLPSTTSARCFQNGYLGRTYRAWSLFLILSMCSSTVHLADTRPHIPPTVAHKYITHTSFISNTHATYGEAGHAPTYVYRLLLFPICQLGSHNITFSHRFVHDDALNLPRIVASATSTRIRRRYRCLKPPAVIFPLSPQIPPMICPRQTTDQATRRARQARVQRQRLAAQQQAQLKSHSPAPLRTLLRP